MCPINENNSPVISADGKSIEWTFGTTEKGRYRWGDTLDNLKVTADTKYTVEVVYKAFSEKSNGAIRCANCKEKLCQHKKQLRHFHKTHKGILTAWKE